MLEDNTIPIPSALVMSQCRFTLDQAYMMLSRVQFADAFPAGASGAAWLLADSSPQAGVNWLCSEMWLMRSADLEAACSQYRGLVLAARAADVRQIATDAEIERMEWIASALTHHHVIPVGLGSGRSSVPYEVHALYHAWFFDMGAPELMARVGSCIVSTTTDRGTERSLTVAPAAPFSELLPFFCDFVFDGDDGPDFQTMLSMQSGISISGGLHLTNSIAKTMVLSMPHYDERISPLLLALSEALSHLYFRDRLLRRSAMTQLSGADPDIVRGVI